MHPALSVVVFTTLSGAGLGVLFLAALLQSLAPLPLSRELAVAPVAVGAALLVAGLGSAFFHLGRPGHAWRAFSQWRTSWLSREAVAATATLGAGAAMAACMWIAPGGTGATTAAIILAGCSVATVYATACIYTSLRTIPAWHNAWVAPTFLLAAGLSGAAVFWLLLSFAFWRPGRAEGLVFALAAVGFALAKVGYWRHIDRHGAKLDTGAVTGLARFGSVRPAEAPHTEANFLLREMGFVLARRHARRLRPCAVVLCGVAPAVGGLLAFAGLGGTAVAATATLSLLAGLLVERWLFFAQARHVVVAYYR